MPIGEYADASMEASGDVWNVLTDKAERVAYYKIKMVPTLDRVEACGERHMPFVHRYFKIGIGRACKDIDSP